MAALTETTSAVTEFAGTYKLAAVEVNPGTTAGWVVVDELDTVLAATTQVISTVAAINANQLVDNPTVACRVDSTTTNQIWFQLLEGDGSVNTQNDLDFFLIAVGTNNNA